MIVKNSLYDRRERVNVDSLLAFDGVNQYADAGVNNNLIAPFSDKNLPKAISFFIQVPKGVDVTDFPVFSILYDDAGSYYGYELRLNNYSRNRFGFKSQWVSNNQGRFQNLSVQAKGSLYHVFLNLADYNNMELFVNGQRRSFINVGQNSGTVTVDGVTPTLYLGYSPWQNKYFHGLLGHVSFHNDTLTETEIRSIHRHGGLIPTSTHAACVAHYVADREGLVIWDVCPQYNYAKESLQKYLPDNLSDFSTGSSVTYDQLDDRLTFSDPDSDSTSVSSSSQAMEGLRENNKYRVEVEVENYQRGQLEVRLNSRMGQNRDNPTNGTNVFIFTQNRYAGEVVGRPTFTCRQGPQFDIVSFKIIPLTEPVLDAYHATLQNFTPQQAEGSGQDAYLDFYDKTPLRPFVDSDGDGEYDQPLVEKSSLLPPLQNALRFDASQNQYAGTSAVFTPSNEDGYTFLYTIQANQKTGPLVSAADNVNNLRISTDVLRYNQGGVQAPQINFRVDQAGVAQYTHVLSGYDIDVSKPLQIIISWKGSKILFYANGRLVAERTTSKTLGFDSINQPLYINNDSFNLASGSFVGTRKTLQLGIAKGIITPRQVNELWNNSLLANPKTSWRNLEWQLLPNFNQINNDGAGNYTLTDNSPQNHTINLQGFTAANFDPQDPAYSLTEINALR